jgi:hypothetical protein
MFCPASQITWRGELADQPDCRWSVALLGLSRVRDDFSIAPPNRSPDALDLHQAAMRSGGNGSTSASRDGS